MNHGIGQNHLQMIRQILAENCPHIDRVSLFGSRATGQFTPTSDIDLVLYGPISEPERDRIHTCFHESRIPHRVDLIAYDHISHRGLKRRVDAIARPLFDRQQLYGIVSQEVV